MFSLLVEYAKNAWETDSLMRMRRDRFTTSGAHEAKRVSLERPPSLKKLEKSPALLMYERGSESKNVNVVRYGFIRSIKIGRDQITFRFSEEGQLPRSVIEENAEHLSIGHLEFGNTHWAVKDGDIPSAVLVHLRRSYDVVLSFAGPDRAFVEAVAAILKRDGVRVFYDADEEAELWGKDLAEHFAHVYQNSARFCVLFISKAYLASMWTRHERKAALARAIRTRGEYMLPARFDDTEIPELLPTIGYVSLANKTPQYLANLILKRLNWKP